MNVDWREWLDKKTWLLLREEGTEHVGFLAQA